MLYRAPFVTLCLSPLIMSLAVALNGCQSATKQGANYSQYLTSTQPLGGDDKDQAQIAQIRTTIAAQYIRTNQLDAAMRQLQQALAADPSFAPAYDMMGVLLQQEGSSINLRKADGYFQQAIALDPNFIQARNNYGVYLAQLKRYREAVQQFEVAAAALGYEGRIGALENLGRTYLQLNNKPAALKAFVRALEGNPNSLIAHIELVDLLIEENKLPQARQLYQETLLLLQSQALSPRVLLQGIKLAAAYQNLTEQQRLSQQLLSNYPLSEEAKQLKIWLNNPEASWK